MQKMSERSGESAGLTRRRERAEHWLIGTKAIVSTPPHPYGEWFSVASQKGYGNVFIPSSCENCDQPRPTESSPSD
tara:strand:- start:9 stop:236 length:228 start_codon:yes stop_codon:yes gene_type:complete